MAKSVYIADVCKEIFAGGDVPKSALSYEKTAEYNVPIFSNGEKNCGLYGYTNNARVKEPSITVSARGTIGYTAIRTEPFVPVVRLITLTPKSEVIDLDYLFYATQNYKFEGSGTSIPQLTVPMLKKYKFPLPEMSHQKAIAVKFEKLDQLISLRKQQLAKLDELVKARFVEMFGEPVSNPYKFEVRSLQNMLDDGIITYHLDGNHGSDYPRNEEFVQTGIPYISANCIVNGNIDFSLAKHLTKERAKKLRKGIAQNGDVLFAHNATVGPVSILHTDEEKVILGTSLTAYRCNKKVVLPPYLKCYMQSDGFVRQYSKDMKQTTRNQVPITIQRKYLFMIPPLSLQNEFAAFVERVDQQKQTVQQSLEKLELMKKALMQEYFG